MLVHKRKESTKIVIFTEMIREDDSLHFNSKEILKRRSIFSIGRDLYVIAFPFLNLRCPLVVLLDVL